MVKPKFNLASSSKRQNDAKMRLSVFALTTLHFPAKAFYAFSLTFTGFEECSYLIRFDVLFSRDKKEESFWFGREPFKI